ncbi:Chaperone protein HscB [Minicystis rosea]|nr:Chaperone protein HscB [Minicystis rosea]
MNDPFDMLGIAPRFALDLAAVELRHRELSKALHPDRYAGAPAAERRMALSRAIDVNEAFRVVKDPIRRAEALLRRAGAAVGETSEPKPSPALLMDMMEAREELAEAGRAKDVARVAKLGEAMGQRQADILRRLGGAFDAAGTDPQKNAEILPVLGELRYIRRFLDEVSAIEEELAL